MDNYSEAKEVVQPKVRFSISREGEVEFDSQGLEDWQLIDALNQVGQQGKDQRRATEKLKEITLTSELLMHGLAFTFGLILVFGTSLTLSRVVSGMAHQSGGMQNVQR